MSSSFPVASPNDPRGFHDEEFADDMPLSAEQALSFAAAENGLYEYLSDLAVPGASTQSVNGHAHGRSGDGGAYVERYGSFDIGHLFQQSTTADSWQPLAWEILNGGGPNGNASESAGARLTTETPGILVDRDYSALVIRLLAKVQSGTSAELRLSLLDNGVVLSSVSHSSSSTQWDLLVFTLDLPEDPACSNWLNLALEFKSAVAGLAVSVAGDDPRFKPLDSPATAGLGLLIGESP